MLPEEQQEKDHDASGYEKEEDDDKSQVEKATSPTNVLGDDNNTGAVDFDLDEWLDRPFYDPRRVLDDPESGRRAKQFAKFVTEDYDKAETVLAGAFFVVMILVSQELVRMQLYGPDRYVPFGSHHHLYGGGGSLF